MNLTRLRAFHLVAHHGSYTAAAAAAGLSQPTLSEQVRQLQQEFGIKLLHRTTHGMVPTGIGVQLLEIAGRLFAVEREAEHLLSFDPNNLKGQVRFGADAPIHAVPALKRLREKHPLITVQLSGGNSTSIRQGVVSGSLDVGIIADPSHHPLLTIELLSTQNLVAVVPRSSPLASGKKLHAAALQDEPLVIREPGSITRNATMDALRDWNLSTAPMTEAHSRESVEAAVLAGLGIGLMGESEFSHDPRLVLLDFEEEIQPMSEFITYRTDRQGEAVIAAVLSSVSGC